MGDFACAVHTQIMKNLVFSNGGGDEELSHSAMKGSCSMPGKDASEQQVFGLA